MDDVQPKDESHFISGFTELGWVDPYSSDPANPATRATAIKKLQDKLKKEEEERLAKEEAAAKKKKKKKGAPVEIIEEVYETEFIPRMSYLKLPS